MVVARVRLSATTSDSKPGSTICALARSGKPKTTNDTATANATRRRIARIETTNGRPTVPV